MKIKKLKKPVEEVQPEAAASVPAPVPEAYYSVAEEQAAVVRTSPTMDTQPTKQRLEPKVEEIIAEAPEPEAPKLVPETVPKLILHLPGAEEDHKERKVVPAHCYCQLL